MRSISRERYECFGRFIFSRVKDNQPCVRFPACRRGRVACEREANQLDDRALGECQPEWSFPRARDGRGREGTSISYSQELIANSLPLRCTSTRLCITTEKYLRYHKVLLLQTARSLVHAPRFQVVDHSNAAIGSSLPGRPTDHVIASMI